MKVYLDAVSTTNVNKEVLDTYKMLLDKYYCNSDALYDDGVAIYDMQEKSRLNIAKMLNVKKDDIIFTAGASEANSLAIKGLCFKSKERRHLITSIYEHSSAYNAFKQMEEFGFDVTYLKPDDKGMITAEMVEKAIRNDTLLVSVMMVNNEIGSVNNIVEIGKIVKRHPGVIFHSDITQAIGKVKVDLSYVDMASFSAHKIHGLKGSGVLYRKSHLDLMPIISGGQQEFSIRGGTSNALANIVLSKTLRLALEELDSEKTRIEQMHARLLGGLKDMAKINSPEGGLKTLLNISTPIQSEVLLNALNDKGIMVSSKSTCGSKKNEPNRTLSNMNVDDTYAIRVSFDHTNTIDEIDYFLKTLKEILDRYVRA